VPGGLGRVESGAPSSGLFFSALDLYTPFSIIYSFYDKVLSPYKDLMLSK
jgi:hypothetical protein